MGAPSDECVRTEGADERCCQSNDPHKRDSATFGPACRGWRYRTQYIAHLGRGRDGGESRGGEWSGEAGLGLGMGMGMGMEMGKREAHDTCNTCRHTIGGKRYQRHPSPALDTHCIESCCLNPEP